MIKSIYLICLFIAVSALHTCFTEAAISSLSPGVELYDQKIHFGETKIYHLQNLVPGADYEVRTSSPGLYAAEFFISLICDVNSLSPETPSQRKLLNVEKTMFSVDAAGFITKCPQEKSVTVPSYAVKVYARLEGTTTDSSLLDKPVSFNIALDSTWYGIPSRVTGIVIFVLFSVIVLLGLIWTAPGLWKPLIDPQRLEKLKAT